MLFKIRQAWIIALLTFTTAAKAQLLQSFTFAGATGTEVTAAPNGQPTNGNLSHIKRGSGITPNNAGGAFGGTGFTTLTAIDTADYFQFGIRANTGYKLNLDSIVVSERRSNTGIRKFVVKGSLDGYAANLSAFDLPDDNLYRNNQNTALGQGYKNLLSTTTASFRYYGFSAENETGSWRLDSIRVYGTIASISTNPTLSWNKDSESIPECLGQVQFQAVLSQTMNEDITFVVNGNGNLSPNELNPILDFSQPVTIPAGSTSVSFQFSSEDDALEEANETTALTITNPSGGVELGANPTFTLTVEDDDKPSQKYQFKQKRLVGNEGTTIQIPIRLHATSKVPPGGFLKVEVKGGSALAADYQSTQIGAFPLTSDSIFNLQVQLLQDGVAEPDGDSLILAIRPSSAIGPGVDFLGSDSVFVLKIMDSQTEPLPPTRTIANIRGNDANGGADSVGKKCRLYGTIYGLNQRLSSAGGGYQMYLRDATGGIGIFKTTPVSGITVLNEGDSVKVMGTIEVFRGLSQINPDSIVVLATGRPIKNPIIANKVIEAIESDLVRLNGVQLVNSANWTTGVGSGGFTVKVFKGTDTTDVRIDNDCPLYNQPAPTGTFDIIGMGSQFVPGTLPLTPPYQGFYQLIPRKTGDVIPTSTTNSSTISWAENSITLLEGNEGFRAINISPAASEAGTYTIVNKSGNLTQLQDYSFTGDTPISTGNTIKTIRFQALTDALVEGTESSVFVLRSTSPSVVVGADSLFTLTILDEDSPVQTGPPFTRTIAQIRGINTDGAADSVGRNVRLFGTVYGVNQRLTATTGGYQMFIRDATGGIGIFKTTPIAGIPALNEGDSIKVMGKIEVFRGLSQINPDSMVVLATGRPLKNPVIVPKVNELLEADLLRLNNVQLVNPSAWTTGTGTGGFTVRVYNGLDTNEVRIDNDCPLYNQPAPSGAFDLIGMGGQFSPTTAAPFVGGYQLVPRKNTDLITGPQSTKPVINFLTSSGSFPEADSTFSYSTIQASITPAADFQPYVFIKGGTATKGLDYPNIQGTQYSMGPGQSTTIQTTFSILDDALPEPNETITFVLRKAGFSGDTNYVIGPDSVFTFTILDNDNATTGIPFTRSIAQVRGNNTGGAADSVGRNVRLFGTVYGVNQRLTATTGGYQMFIRDATGGIGIFKTTPIAGIPALNEGDSIKVMGKIEVFRGLSQINPDSMVVLATGRPLKNPVIVPKVNELLEADLLRLNNVQLVNPSAWTTGTGTGGFTVRVYNGLDTNDVRIDNDCPLYNQPAPTGAFDLIGMGGQFSPTTAAPFVGGYQLVPRKIADLIPVVLNNPVFTFVPSSNTVAENAGAVQITVSTPVAPTSDITLSVLVKSGSATSGDDFQPLGTNSLTFVGGSGTTQTFSVNVIDDVIQEPTENIILVIRKQTSSTEFSIGTDSLFTLSITDNDSQTEPFPPTRTIAQIRGSNTGGAADSVGRNVRLFGTVYGVNQRLTATTGGYQMFIRDATGGIGIFKTTPIAGIPALNEGDSIKVMGKIEVFRGLSQINPDSMVVLATGRPLKNPVIVPKVNELLEADLLRLNNVQLVNPSAWTTGTGTGGFTVRVYNGLDTNEVRIDNDCPLYNQPAPSGAFDLIGMGGQFSPTTAAPFVGGYQLVPRKIADLIPNTSVDPICLCKSELMVFPNPGMNLLNLQTKENSGFHYRIFSLVGDLMWEKTKAEASEYINTTSWAAGIYVIKVTETGKVIKWIKN